MEENKVNALLAHVTIIGTIVSLLLNNEKKDAFTGFYNRQMLGVFLSFHILSLFVSQFDSWILSSANYIFFFVLWLHSLISCFQDRTTLVPVLGKYYQNWFKNL